MFSSEIYIEKEQIASAKNNQALRKSPGHVPRVRDLKLITCKEDPPQLYKINFVTEWVKWFLKCRLGNMIFFPEIFVKKEQFAVQENDQATRKSPGHITWVRALGLIIFKENLHNCLKLNSQRN
jgi:hypothetical protein